MFYISFDVLYIIELCKHDPRPISDQNSQMLYYKTVYQHEKVLYFLNNTLCNSSCFKLMQYLKCLNKEAIITKQCSNPNENTVQVNGKAQLVVLNLRETLCLLGTQAIGRSCQP